MNKFNKIVATAPVSLMPWAKEELKEYAEDIVLYEDAPADDDEIIERIGDADAMLVYTTPYINARILSSCPNLSYVGMTAQTYDRQSRKVLDNIKKHSGEESR